MATAVFKTSLEGYQSERIFDNLKGFYKLRYMLIYVIAPSAKGWTLSHSHSSTVFRVVGNEGNLMSTRKICFLLNLSYWPRLATCKMKRRKYNLTDL